jgi:hypothetical protein
MPDGTVVTALKNFIYELFSDGTQWLIVNTTTFINGQLPIAYHTGTSITLIKNCYNLINTSSNCTVTFPSGTQGDWIWLIFPLAIGTVTYAGTTVLNQTNGPSGKSNRPYFYINTLSAWD